MNAADVREVAVIGAGLMGHAIAVEFAAGGYPVRLHDADPGRLAEARVAVDTDLAVLRNAGLLSEEQASASARRVSLARDLPDAVRSADFVVEAVFEDIDVKRAAYEQIEAAAPAHAVIASNTSSLLPTSLAERATRPERLVVAHHFHPPHLIPLVEVVPGPETDDAVVACACEVLRRVGKRPVVLRREIPGFVANRLQAALLREALAIVASGAATAEDVDAIVCGSFGRRLAVAGPLALFDMAGLDVILAIAEQVFPDMDASREAPAALRALVSQGALGVKAGRGTYRWDEARATALRARVARALARMAKEDAAAEA